MNFELKNEKLIYENKSQDYAAQQNIEFEINLPDYCSDIKRILKCLMIPGVSSVSKAQDSVTISGVVTVRLIYISEKDKLDCFETQKDFSQAIKTGVATPENVLLLKTKTNYTNCRAISQRKVNISGNIGITLNTITNEEMLFPCNAKGAGVETKTIQAECISIISQKDKTFEMSETASLAEDKSAIGKIVHVHSYAVVDSKKTVSDKLLIKGELYTNILYLADRQDNTLCRFSHSMPISQIIDLPGIDENSETEIILDIRQTLINVKEDSSSQNRLIEIAAKVNAFVSSYKKSEIKVITDTYSVSHNINTEYTIKEFLTPIHSADRQKTINRTLDLPSCDIKQICDVWVNDITYEMKGKDNTATANCSLNLGILYIDSSDCPEYTEKALDFSFDEKLSQGYDFIKCSFKPTIRNISFRLKAKDKIDVGVECGIYANIYSAKSIRLLKQLSVEDEKQTNSNAALTVYFCKKGESVWDIARKYNTTSSLISNENNIGDTIPDEMQMLLIECV